MARSWVWGPEALSPVIEEFDSSAPGGVRRVQYFDKGRIQFNPDASAAPEDPDSVTGGLIIYEMISGRYAADPWSFIIPGPAKFSVAGDADDGHGPTYASFQPLLNAPPAGDGETLINRIARDGAVRPDPALASYGVTASYHVQVTGLDHQIASPFWEFIDSKGEIYANGMYRTGPLFEDKFAVFGLPITEAYWATVTLEGQDTDVLIQLFERRVLTYIPRKPAGWRVQLANAGQHYLTWRYRGDLSRAKIVDPSELPVQPAAPGPDLGTLEAEIHTLIAGWQGQQAATIIDLQTSERISINGDRRQLAACTIKAPIMVAVAQDIQAGKYTITEIEHLVVPAMGPSANPPARELIRLAGDGDIGAGLQRVNQIMWDLGATDSIMTHPPGYFGEEYGYAASHGTVSNLLTSDDAARLMAGIWRNEMGLSSEMHEYVLWSLTIATPFLNGSLGGPLPAEATLYHKIGVLYEPLNTWNDAGIVVFNRDGRQYAYAIAHLSEETPGSYRTGYWYGYTLSDLVWQAFNTL